MDDGVPNSGTVRAVLQSTPDPDVLNATTAAVAYVETGTNDYTICRSL